MHTQPLPALRGIALLAAVLVSGCAASSPMTGTRALAPGDTTIVVDVNLRRSAELIDNRGMLRLFHQDLHVEYRRGGRGPGLEAGEVTLDTRALLRVVSGKGAVSYRFGRDESPGAPETRDEPWASLTNTGAPGVPAALARVKLAPFPVVTQPTPGQAVLRGEDLLVVMLPPVAGVWYRVTIDGTGTPVTGTDLGQGRWLFTRGALEALGQGRARVLIEVETSCGNCEVGERLRASWSSRGELEIPLTLL